MRYFLKICEHFRTTQGIEDVDNSQFSQIKSVPIIIINETITYVT